ncbi:MAG: hypothetical protein HY763_15600 [Planctomycetes bacterium]|nr:hypothetical protein [Planctomycetota bacterium]
MSRALLLCLAMQCALAAPPDEAVDVALERRQQELAQRLGSFDWAREYPAVERAMTNIWRDQGWGEEADRFALELVRDVSRLPPWDLPGRFDVISAGVARRYGLSAEQKERFQRMVLRETALLLTRNAEVILRQTSESLQARGQGVPFAPEQIARWTKESEPLLADARDSFQRMLGELRQAFTEDQQRILDRDVASYEKRMAHLDRMRARWAEGRWSAEDWGLQDDAVQARAAAAAEKAAGSGGAAPPRGAGSDLAPAAAPLPPHAPAVPTRWYAHDPATWIAYRLHVQRRYALEAGQVTAAESIHEELLERARAYVEPRRSELDAVAAGDRATHAAYAPLRELFAELQVRLEALPTTTQRQNAER